MHSLLNKKPISQKGFTIVELLIVVIVIAILATVVTVGYLSIRRNAANTALQADLKEVVAQVSSNYLNKGKYPATAESITINEDTALSYSLRPYGYCATVSGPGTSDSFRVRSYGGNTIEEGNCDYEMDTQWVGSATSGYADGIGDQVQFVNSASYSLGPLAVDSDGAVYVANTADHRLRKISPDGSVTTVAGDGTNNKSAGVGTSAALGTPTGLLIGPDGIVYISGDNRLWTYDPDTSVVTMRNMSGTVSGITPEGDIYMSSNGCVVKYTLSGTPLRTIGTCGSYGFNDGPGATALFSSQTTAALGGGGVVYVADRGNNRVRAIAPDGTVSTFFGNGSSSGNSAPIDGATGTATLGELRKIAVDKRGAVWVTTKNNFMYLRTIEPDGSTIKTHGGTKDGVTQNYITGPEPANITIDSANGYMYVSGISPYVWRVRI